MSSLASSVDMGQQRYERSLASALADVTEGSDVGFSTFTVASARSRLPADRKAPLRRLTVLPPVPQRLAGRILYPRADVLHRTDLRLPASARASREVVTVHDLCFMHFDDEGAVPRRGLRMLEDAAAVVTGSEWSAAEIASVLGCQRVFAIHHGVDREFLDARLFEPSERETMGLTGRFVLHGGGATTRKNLAGLAGAWPVVRSRFPDALLALTGPPDPRRDKLFSQLEGVRVLGMVPLELRARLVASAAVVVVPSRYEGFGLPAVEAMAAGTPVVATDCASLPEVCGSDARLVRPDAESLADGICDLLGDRALCEKFVEAGRRRAERFTWPEAASQHLELYRSLA